MLGKLKEGGRSKSKAFDLPGFIFCFLTLTCLPIEQAEEGVIYVELSAAAV